MPVKIPRDLPARDILSQENIFVMESERAENQDIRPLKIGILNLMPTKIQTETQLLRVLGNTPLQLEITLLRMASHQSKNTSEEHLESFYRTFDQVKDEKFDGLIITGAPIELVEFEEVDYWDELCMIMDWADHHIFSTLFICWAAQAGLYHHHGIQKHELPHKLSGVFKHKVLDRTSPLTRGFDDIFYAPHSRHTTVYHEDVAKNKNVQILSESDEAGVYLATANNGRQVFVTGHSEYDWDTLANEYRRDSDKGLDIPVPCNYFPDDDPTKEPVVLWRGHSNLLFSNWLNFYVYQETPYDINDIK